MHRARAALPMVAPFFCSSQQNALAKAIQQGCAGIDAKLVVFAVDAERNWHSAFNGWPAGPRRSCLLRRVCCQWHICRNYSCGCGTAGGRKKCAASPMLRVRLLLVCHEASVRASTWSSPRSLAICVGDGLEIPILASKSRLPSESGRFSLYLVFYQFEWHSAVDSGDAKVVCEHRP